MQAPRSLCVLQTARAARVALERGHESHAQARVERPSSRDFAYLVLFQSLQTARAREVALKHPLTYLHVRSSDGRCARAGLLFCASGVKSGQVHFSILIAS